MKHLYKFSLFLLALLLPATALAHDFEVDGIYYNINGNEATVTYKGAAYNSYNNEYSGDVTIPATVTYGGATYSVTTIGEWAFSICRGLTSIIIPNSVTTIGEGAFYNCSGLTSITIPNSVTSISYFAFSYCTGLTSIVVASGNPTYDSRNNSNAIIETATNTLVAGCNNTIIPNSVTSIGINAFYGCTGLTSIDIPNSVTSIGYAAFSNCTGLTSITVASSNPIYDSRNNCNAILETATNTLVAGCKNTIIPNSVTAIGSVAFLGCSRLTSIDIPNSVTSIGNGAFWGCSGLTNIYIPNSVTSIGNTAFYNTAWYNNQPDGLVYAGLVVYNYKGTMPSGTSIIIRDGTYSITGSAFYNCTGLTSVTIPSSVISIGEAAFYGCSGLTSINIPNSVTSIGNSAFSGCTGLTSIDIPNSVTSIGDYAFSNCTGLTSIDIPNSVTTIGEGAFSSCTGLTSATFPNSIISIGNSAFSGCTGLTSITIPNSVTSIGVCAFADCSGLTEIFSLALAPPTIGYNTFYGCYGATLYVPKETVNAYKAANYWKNFTNIVGVIIPGTSLEVNGIYYLVTDENSVFVTANENVDSYYSGDVVIPDSVIYEGMSFAVTGIEGNAFEDCYELTSITIPNSVETIGEQAFQGCTGLTSVTIGSGVTAIGAKAFNYCNALETVKCLGKVPPVMASADCFSTAAYNRATLLVPRQQIEAYQAADYWYKFAHIEGWGSAGRGDIDGDGIVSINDVTRMIDAILTGEHEGVYFESADLNFNGRLDIGDVTTIIDMLLNGN